MSPRLRNYVLLALLLLVPLQGVAAMVHALGCVQQGEHAAAASAHTHAGHDHGVSHHHPDETSGGNANDHASHQCCHHFSVAPVYVSSDTHNVHSVFQSSVALLDLSVVLERPQRPPRA
jgi:hypothetical protein